MDYLYVILRIVATLIGLVTLYCGFYLVMKTEGKLEKAIIFVTGSVAISTLVNILGLIESFYAVNLNMLRAFANPIGILFILLAACTIKKLVDEVNKKSNKNLKKGQK